MSYDLDFDCGPLAAKHNITGGTYAMGGDNAPYLNITWNYAPTFYGLWPGEGIRYFDGKSAENIITELDEKIGTLSGEPDEDYWAATEGNAKAALISLQELAKLVPPDSKLSVY